VLVDQRLGAGPPKYFCTYFNYRIKKYNMLQINTESGLIIASGLRQFVLLLRKLDITAVSSVPSYVLCQAWRQKYRAMLIESRTS
jgi:hypothetical protein